MKTTYISHLPMEKQIEIKQELIATGLMKEDIERAMSSRLCDLEDTINISSFF